MSDYAPPADHPWYEVHETVSAPRTALVIGAGLAGCAVAWSLAKRGVDVTLIDRGSGPATGASGNPLGLLMPYLSVVSSPLLEFYSKAFPVSERHLQLLATGRSASPIHRRGAAQLFSTSRLSELALSEQMTPPAEKRDRLWKIDSAPELSDRLGIHVSGPGFWVERALTVSPGAVCRAQLSEVADSVRTVFETAVNGLRYEGGLWNALEAKGELVAAGDLVVIASAFECGEFRETAFLPVEAVRGEIVYLESETLRSVCRAALCFSGYLLPSESGYHVLGASYRHRMDSTEQSIEEQQRMLLQLKSAARNYPALKLEQVGGRVSFRASTHDRLPYVGPVPDIYASEAMVRGLRSGTNRDRLPPIPYLPGCYVSVGHGSRGLVSAHYSAECIAEHAVNKQPVSALIHPGRVAIRQLRGSIGVTA